jgi:hypothetical protein
MKRYQLDPKKPPRLIPAEERRLETAAVDYSDTPLLGDDFFTRNRTVAASQGATDVFALIRPRCNG